MPEEDVLRFEQMESLLDRINFHLYQNGALYDDDDLAIELEEFMR